MWNRGLLVRFCAALFLSAAPAAFGQGLTGTLTGTVTDPHGAVVPSAAVVLKNDDSGDIRRTASNAEGYFTIAAVPAGTYTVTVTAQGFDRFVEHRLIFNGEDKRNIDAVLKVGNSSQTVEVVADLEAVPVDSGEKAEVLDAKQLQDYSAVGRSAAEFIKLLPGMAQTGNGVVNSPGFDGQVMGINGNGDAGHQSALGYYSANGTPPSSMEITSDGAHVSDPGCNCATPVNPNTDMIQEFKVLTSNFSAENSKGPVVISSIAKAGTKRFHGEAYLYARNYILNSADWLDNKNGLKKPANKYFFPGGNFGGPVLIPGTNFNKRRDRLFFFTGFEYYYQNLDTGQVTASVPTAAMRSGDFSPASIAALGPVGQVPGNPTTLKSAQFPTGVIPASQFDKGGQILMNLYPLPNANPFQTGGYNYVQRVVFDQNSYQSMSRVDYAISENTKLFVRYNLQNELQRFPIQLWGRSNPSDQVPYPSQIVSPNQSQSVSADLTHVFSTSLTNEFVFGYTYINFPNEFENPSAVDRTAIGYPYQGIFHNGIKQIPNITGSSNSTAYINNYGGFEVGNGNLFAIKHLMSFSDNLSKVLSTHTLKFGGYFERITNDQPSSSNVQGTLTFATSNTQSSGNAYADMLLGRVSSFSQQNYNVPYNEAYRVFEFYAQDSWKARRRLTIDIGMRFSHLGQWYDLQGLGFAVWNPATYTADTTAFLPAVLWNKRDSSVPISGHPTRALFYAPRVGMAWDVFGTGKTVVRGGWGAYRYHLPQSTDGLSAPTGSFSSSIPSPMTFAAIDAINAPKQSTYLSSQTLLDAKNDQEPLTYTYSFTISQRVMQFSTLEVAYVGNRSLYQYENVFHNQNAVPYGTLLSVPNANGANYNLYRPLSYYQDINIGVPDNYSNHNALQVSFNRRRGRYSYMVNYTFGKTMGIATTADRLHQDQNYGPLSYDRRHVFNAAYSVELPNPMHGNAVLKGVVNGWQLSGVAQVQSGASLQFNVGGGNFSTALPGGSSISTRTVNGTNSIQLQPILTCNPTANLADHQYINAACFSLPSPGVNGPIVMPEMFGPWFFNSDLSAFKNFKIKESQKIQFRFSAYNFLNHPVYTFGKDNNLNLSFGSDGKVNNALFGYTTNKTGRRLVQLAVKYYF